MSKRKAAQAPAHRSVARPSSTKVPAGSAHAAINKTSPQQPSPTHATSHKAAPVVELAQVAGVIPAENLQQLATAIQSGRWLFAVWHVADGRLHLERTATNFPTVDLEKSVAMLADNLKELSLN